MPSRKQSNRVTVYEPNHIMKAGIRVWPEMFRELADFRGLIWRLVVRDLSARYKQSVLGIFWAFLAPLIMMIVFVWVKGKNILPIGDTAMPYAAFVFLGQMVWLLFAGGVTSSANSMEAFSPGRTQSCRKNIALFTAWLIYRVALPIIVERIESDTMISCWRHGLHG